ncbi:MAG: GNAT family N-acetyltransferase [Clostridium sp.]|nr:GNAT family N-acetyltransferase [Clostridium sp.]MCM1444219.1 GNAT family N-acetyltransferase [Candidatus Amulumruptor caecigallinarius]
MKSLYNLTYEKLNLKNLEIAYKIQKETWPDNPDYDDLYDKAVNTKDDNCFFLVYDNDCLIGITGVDFYDKYPESIWMDWFTVLPTYRQKGYGKKILLDTIYYCKSLNKFETFTIDTTYYENRPALILYDKVMELREDYTIEDTKDYKNDFVIYSYSLNGKLEPWNNKYLGLKEYYDNCK